MFVLSWNYSSGERAGWVQKFSKKGWLCKTWEGEMAMVTMPGSTPEKFLFTVWDDAVAEQINQVMGKRVTLHYDEKVGLPTSCFGETRHFVTGVAAVDEIPLAPGDRGAGAGKGAGRSATRRARLRPRPRPSRRRRPSTRCRRRPSAMPPATAPSKAPAAK